MLTLFVAHDWLALFENDQTLGLRELVAGLEVEQQISAKTTPAFEAHCNIWENEIFTLLSFKNYQKKNTSQIAIKKSLQKAKDHMASKKNSNVKKDSRDKRKDTNKHTTYIPEIVVHKFCICG